MADLRVDDNQEKDQNPGGAGELENAPHVQADRGSVAVGGISVGRDLKGKVTIAGGDVYEGYTVEQVTEIIQQIKTQFQPKSFEGRCPYKGLEVFKEEDTEFFFGREALVKDLVRRLQTSRTVFVAGPSGSGKSSLLRAGLIPALKQGAIKKLHSEHWLYETLKPGREPMIELARVASSLSGTLNAGEDIRTKGRRDASILAQWCEIALKDDREKRAILLVDQFEEVFTQIDKEPERLAFLHLLTYAATSMNGRVILLFAMRSDFLPNCARYSELNALLNQQFIQIGAMQRDELVRAIAQPALRVGLQIDPELVAQIIYDMQGAPGALPLMQFALKDLFDFRQTKGGFIALTLNDYNERGGIYEALEHHADASFAELKPNEQELARAIFSGLIKVGRGTQDTRRTALFTELVPANASAGDVQEVIQKLADARLITTDEKDDNKYTITHEKLITAWPWLEKLVNENRDVIALQNEIASDAKEWEDHQRDPSYLYTGARLANAREQLEAKKLVLSVLAQEFIESGVKAHTEELEAAQQRAAQLRKRSVYLSVALVVALIAVGAAILFGNRAQRSADLAIRQAGIADAAQISAILDGATAQAASTIAVAQAEEAKKQTKIALARQLAAQAQPLSTAKNSKQIIAVLLAIQSMQWFPSVEAFQVLDRNLLAYHVAFMTHDYDSFVYSVAFSPDGKYVVSGGKDNTARIWEAKTGKEVARMAHEEEVIAVAFSPDGRYVVSATWKTVHVWEVATGKEVTRMTHEDGDVRAVAFSPDGNYVLSKGDKTARVWDAATGKDVAYMTHGRQVNFAAFSPDGQSVISAGCDELDSNGYTCLKGSVRIWEVLTGKEVHHMIEESGVSSAALSADGQYGVAGNSDGTLRVWQLATGSEVAQIKTSSLPVSSVAFSPDGKYVVSGGGRIVQVWDVATGEQVTRITHDAPVLAVAFDLDGKYGISWSSDGVGRVWEATTGKEISILVYETLNGDPWISSITFSPDRNYVAVGGCDHAAGIYCILGGIHVWELRSKNRITRLTHGLRVKSVAFSPDGRYVVSAGCEELGSNPFTCSKGSTRVWEVTTGKEIIRISDDPGVQSAAFSPDGKYIVSTGCDHFEEFLCDKGSITVWGASSGHEITGIVHDGPVNSVAISLDSKYIVSAGNDKTARIWEAATGKEIARMSHDSAVLTVAFSPDGKFVASGDNSGTAIVWKATDGKEVSRMLDSTNNITMVHSIAFSPDGKYVVSGSSNGTIRVWEATTGNEILSISYMDAENNLIPDIYAVRFSPDGKYVVSGGCDQPMVESGCFTGSARVWDAETGREITRMVHEAAVNSVAFSPDGKYVLSMDQDNATRVWEAATGQEVARLAHAIGVTSVAFSPDGKYIVSGSVDGEVTLQEYRAEDLIADACSRVTRNLTGTEWKQYVGDALPFQAVCPKLPAESEQTFTP